MLSSVIGAKITYSFLGGGQGNAPIMLMLTILFGMLLGLISGVLYVVLHLPPIITSLGVTLIYEGILFTITEGRYVMKEVQNYTHDCFYRKLALCSNYYCGGTGNYYWTL